MKKLLKEFRDFIAKGNVMDLAVGVIIGAAFKDIVTSLTDNLISPILGLFGKVDLSDYQLVLKQSTVIGPDGTPTVQTVALRYGAFLTAVINFIIMAFIIFLIVKAIKSLENMAEKRLQKLAGEKEAAPTEKTCPYCQSKISILATRCPFCTSLLEETAETDSNESEPALEESEPQA